MRRAQGHATLAASNHIRRFTRPEYIAHRNFTPIQCLPDDCLLRDYDVPLPWQEGTPESALQPLFASKAVGAHESLCEAPRT